MSDQILIEMSEKLGRVAALIEGINDRHDATMKTIVDHGTRISTLEETKHKAHGFTLAIAAVGATLGGYASHALGIFR